MQLLDKQIVHLNNEIATKEAEITSQQKKLNLIIDKNQFLKNKFKNTKLELINTETRLNQTKDYVEILIDKIEQQTKTLNDLKLNMATLVEEKEQLQKRLSSIDELKEAIRDLKKKKFQAEKELPEKIRTTDRDITGNKGFLVSTDSTKPQKLKVKVLLIETNGKQALPDSNKN